MGECYFWYRLARVVQYKGLLNSCVCVCVCASSCLTPFVILFYCMLALLTYCRFSCFLHCNIQLLRSHRTRCQLDGHEPSSAECRKDRIHMVFSTTSAPSVSVISSCSWLCSGDTSRLSARPQRLPGQQHVNEVAHYQAHVHVLRQSASFDIFVVSDDRFHGEHC